MADSQLFANEVDSFSISLAVQEILTHLCEGDCHTFGDLLEWCESRGDCSHAIVCPECKTQFLIDEDELQELRMWTIRNGSMLVCGVRYDD
jgi:hypothetical protein